MLKLYSVNYMCGVRDHHVVLASQLMWFSIRMTILSSFLSCVSIGVVLHPPLTVCSGPQPQPPAVHPNPILPNGRIPKAYQVTLNRLHPPWSPNRVQALFTLVQFQHLPPFNAILSLGHHLQATHWTGRGLYLKHFFFLKSLAPTGTTAGVLLVIQIPNVTCSEKSPQDLPIQPAIQSLQVTSPRVNFPHSSHRYLPLLFAHSLFPFLPRITNRRTRTVSTSLPHTSSISSHYSRVPSDKGGSGLSPHLLIQI